MPIMIIPSINSASVGSLICFLSRHMLDGMCSFLSTDGINYTRHNPLTPYLSVLANATMLSDGTDFYAFWSGPNLFFHKSSDGLAWTETAFPVSIENPVVAYGDGKIVVVDCTNGISLVSSNGGTSWTQSTAPVMYVINLTYIPSSGIFMLASQDTEYATSTDGLTWTERTYPVGIGGGPTAGA